MTTCVFSFLAKRPPGCDCAGVMSKVIRLVLGCLVFGSLFGCGGEQRTPEQGGWGDELADPTGQPLRKSETMTEEGKTPPSPAGAGPTTPAIETRVRHDVMITKETPHEANCSCLMVIAAPPGDPRIAWQNDAPKLEQDVLVVAMSGKGVACPGLPEDAQKRPSFSGVEREGADVVLTIEELPPGRPLATGAVVALPGKGGSVYVKPRGGKVPYGRPLAGGAGRCKVR